jgi:hypothetical protein
VTKKSFVASTILGECLHSANDDREIDSSTSTNHQTTTLGGGWRKFPNLKTKQDSNCPRGKVNPSQGIHSFTIIAMDNDQSSSSSSSSSSASYLIASCLDSTIRIWQLPSMEEIAIWESHQYTYFIV